MTSSGAAVSQMSDGGIGRPVGSAARAAAPATSSYSPVSTTGGTSSSSSSAAGSSTAGGSSATGSGSGSAAAPLAAHSASPSASAASGPPGLSWPARSSSDMWIGSVSSARVWLPVCVSRLLAVDQLEVAQKVEVALALALERVLVVPAGAAEVGQRAAEVERR